MNTSKIRARQLIEMLSDEALLAMRIMAGIVEGQVISEESLAELVDLSLGRTDTNLMNGSTVFLLTPLGKRVVSELKADGGRR